MRIPYSQLRFSRDEHQTWGLQVWRYVDRLNEQDMWSYRRRDEAAGPAYFGHIEGLAVEPAARARRSCCRTSCRAASSSTPIPGDPYRNSRESKVNAGADVKYNLTSNLTLDATINPDFGQVEVDPASLNLSAYETFYDEKRPFFVANRSAFSFGGASCIFCSNFSGLGVLYSRRIGRPPQLNGWVANRASFVDAPDDATILGAAKITGRTSSGYTVGLLDAIAGQETARYLPSAGGPERTQTVEPLTNYFVGRVRKDLRQGATTVGVVATSTVRSLGGDSVLTAQLRDNATVLGIDWSHSWHNREYRWRGTLVGSDVSGSANAIALTQRSSTHYFQRPDRRVTTDGLFDTGYDTTATSLRGYGFYTRLAKENGNWLWEAQTNWRSPGFEINDLSFLDRTDYKWMSANVARNWLNPGTLVSEPGHDHRRPAAVQLRRQAHRRPAAVLLRPRVPQLLEPALVLHPQEHDGRRPPHARRAPVKIAGLELRPPPGLDRPAPARRVRRQHRGIARHRRDGELRLLPRRGAQAGGEHLRPARAELQLVAEHAAVHRDGRRSDGDRVRRQPLRVRLRDDAQLSLETRVNWTLRPTVTLQLYAQPFFASGDYSSFSEFAAPRVVKQLEYGKDIGHGHARRDDGHLHARSRRRERTGGAVHPRRSELLRPLAARHGGAAVGVSPGLDDVLRLDAAALGRIGGRRPELPPRLSLAVRRSPGQRVPGQGDVLGGAITAPDPLGTPTPGWPSRWGQSRWDGNRWGAE